MEEKHTCTFPILSSVISFLLTGIYLLLRFPFEQDHVVVLKILGISLSLINIPYGLYLIFRKHTEYSFYTVNIIIGLALLLVLVIFGLLGINIIVYLFFLFGIVAFLVALFYYVRSFSYSSIFQLIFIVIFSIWLSGVVWEGANLTPVFLEKIITGFYNSPAGIDNLFHMSMAQMIKTYNISSTGLDELPYIPYHFGSHFLFAQISKVLGISIINMYHLGFPVIFLSLFFHIAFLVYHQFNDLNNYSPKFSYVFWIFLFALFLGILPIDTTGIAFRTSLAWNTLITSESYLVSMIFFFAFLSLILIPLIINGILILNTKLLLLVILLLVFIGLSKISTLYILDFILAYFYVRCKLYKLRIGNILLFSAVILSILLFLLFNDSKISDGNGRMDFLNFYNHYIKSSFTSYILLSFLWTFVLIWMCLFLYMSKIKVSYVLLELQILIAIAGFLPGLFLNISGGSANFFSDIQHWTAFLFIPYYFSFIVQGLKKTPLIFVRIISIVVIITSFLNSKQSFERVCTDNYITKSLILGNADCRRYVLKTRGIIANYSTFIDKRLNTKLAENSDFSKLKFLISLDDLDNKKRKILFILDDHFLSKYFSCYKAPFFISAATGMSTFNGFSIRRCSCRNYGFEYYTREGVISKDENICRLLNNPVFMEVVYCNIAEQSYNVARCKK